LKNKVVVTLDLDGTLLAHGNEILGGQKTLDCLSELVAMGVGIVINTGRLDHDILAIQNGYHLPISARVSQNGCVVIDDTSVQASIMDKKEAQLVWAELRLNNEIRTEVNTVSNRCWLTLRGPDLPKEYYDSHILQEDFTEFIDNQPCTLFLCLGDSEKLEKVRHFVEANCQTLQAVMTSKKSLEIYAKGISKGATISQLFADSYIYGIGDSENDFFVFEVSDQAFCVSEETVHPKAQNVARIDDALTMIKEDILHENRLTSLR